jgi:LysM repeat protein
MSYQYNNNNGGYQQQGGYQQSRPGEASQYYSEGQRQHPSGQDYGQPPPQYQQHQSSQFNSPQQSQNSYGNGQGYNNPSSYETQQGFENSEGERGLMGGLAGGAAGAFGGHKVGGMTGHSKTSTIFGAVAGAFAGHKLQDGVSDWKDDRDERKEEEKRRREEEERRKHEQQNNNHHHGSNGHYNEKPRGGNYAGNFTTSSRDIRLDAHGDYNLHASCRRSDGSYQSSTISLNRILENDDGSFRWSKANTNSNSSSTVTVQQGDTLRAIAARHNCDFHEIARQNGIQNEDLIYPGQVLNVPGGGRGGGANFGASARDVRLVDGGQRLEGELRRGGNWVQSSIVLDERIGNRDGCLEVV